MATNITLADLITHVRQRADMELRGIDTSNFVSDSEITHMVNDEIDKLYAKMVNVDDGKLFATVAGTLTALGNNSFQLPNDFMRLVDVNISTGSRWVPAFEADSQDYYPLLTRNYSGDYDVRYFLKLNQSAGRYELFLFPSKDVSVIGVRYIPEAPKLTLTTDTLKWPSNWHAPVVDATAARCLEKEESEATHMVLRAERGTSKVLKDIRSQSVAEVKTLRDIAGRNRRRKRQLPWI